MKSGIVPSTSSISYDCSLTSREKARSIKGAKSSTARLRFEFAKRISHPVLREAPSRTAAGQIYQIPSCEVPRRAHALRNAHAGRWDQKYSWQDRYSL